MVKVTYKMTPWVVVESPAFVKKAERIFKAPGELDDVIETIAKDPEAGDVIVGTGGVRKLKIQRGNRGKSAGVRVVYYFHGDESLPIYVLAIFTAAYERDPVALMQFALAVLLDKPLYLLAPTGRLIAANVRAVAAGIEFYDPDDPATFDHAMRRLMAKRAQ